MGLIRHSNPFEVGIDEAGRGCLAGPVIACSFMPGPDFIAPRGLNDSKKMTERQREYCFEYLVENYRDRFGTGVVNASIIDKINILQSALLAMRLSLTDNQVLSQHYNTNLNFSAYLLVDGNRFDPTPHLNLSGGGGYIPHETVIKGDGKYVSIAAASVLAKVTRDRLMTEMSKDPKYAMYGWDKNKSYCTKSHIDAIIKHGMSDEHRLTFNVPGYEQPNIKQK